MPHSCGNVCHIREKQHGFGKTCVLLTYDLVSNERFCTNSLQWWVISQSDKVLIFNENSWKCCDIKCGLCGEKNESKWYFDQEIDVIEHLWKSSVIFMVQLRSMWWWIDLENQVWGKKRKCWKKAKKSSVIYVVQSMWWWRENPGWGKFGRDTSADSQWTPSSHSAIPRHRQWNYHEN